MRRMATPVVLLGLACFAMAGCVSLGPKADPTRFFTLTPLPHLPGELLVRHTAGWTGRARAWEQEGYLLALAWQC